METSGGDRKALLVLRGLPRLDLLRSVRYVGRTIPVTSSRQLPLLPRHWRV